MDNTGAGFARGADVLALLWDERTPLAPTTIDPSVPPTGAEGRSPAPSRTSRASSYPDNIPTEAPSAKYGR